MDRTFKLVLQEAINQPLAGQGLQPRKGGRFDRHDEMALPALPRPGMAGMAIRLIDDVQAAGGQARGKYVPHRVGDFSHSTMKAPRLCAVNS